MALLYCECGHKVWSELWWKESKDVLLFFDDLGTSETYGERVIRCPGCDQKLRSGLLKPEGDGYGAGAWRHQTV